MLQILLHSSKTMSDQSVKNVPLSPPLFKEEAFELASVWQKASPAIIKRQMQISDAKAAQVKQLYTDWSLDPERQTPAIDAFRGDIYSGLQVAYWSEADREYAHRYLIILSGLYGALRACDGIRPYRLEMGYKLPDGRNMYDFWGSKLTRAVPTEVKYLVNLSAVEYTKALLPHSTKKIITPKFMTISPKTGQPTFVTVHAKIARGAFARWMIQKRINNPGKLPEFANLGYYYTASLSTPEQPVFVCDAFQGIGLSVRK